MNPYQRKYRRMTDHEERAFSRLYPAVRDEPNERSGVYTFQEGSNIVIELAENITMPKQRFFRIVAEYKRLRALRRTTSRCPKHSAFRSSPLNPHNDTT
ncbi:hypothetical protein CCHR01_13210 [Colletotrichum chrysophilum]|uniref:Uncharacterized protein n=1 Tax=Colletotrichum chrysophilum TaxID=1836956 RepID=A0AAD9ED45_9PEZI|nr:hypothetical protein CCHR01_13210 [Colletotrichum chrysophilum]